MSGRVPSVVLLAALLVSLSIPRAQAKFAYFQDFSSRYDSSPLLAMGCTVCHPDGDTGKYTLYGADFKAKSGTPAQRMAAVEPLDSDDDKATNLQEITAGTDPSDNTKTPPKPQVASILRQNPAAQFTTAASVIWRVTFSEAVSGVAAADFALHEFPGGTLAGYSITSVAAVAGTGNKSFDVTVNTGTGSGELRLDVAAGAVILNTGGMNLGNIPYTTGQTYKIRPNAVRGWAVYK